MKIIIAASYSDVTNVKEMFSNLLLVKGSFPKIKSCHDDINKYKYSYDKKSKTGWQNEDYPKNVKSYIKDQLEENDIIIIPLETKLIGFLKKSDKFKNIFIYEKEIDEYMPKPGYPNEYEFD